MAPLTIAVILLAVLDIEATQIVFFEPNVFRREINDDITPRQGIGDCNEDEIIRLSGLRLTKIPEKLVNSSSIRSVLLNSNELSTISLDAFAGAPLLECLNLADNRIPLETLQNGHPTLKKLILDYQRLPESSNMVSDVCTPLGSFPSLTSLSLKGADRDCFDVMTHTLPALSSIDLSDNNLQHVNLTQMTSGDEIFLRNIYLKRNKIEQFQLDYIGNVEALYLDENPLRIVHIDASNQNLKTLSLAGCSTSLTNDLILPPSLITLDLSGNRIRELPITAFLYTPYLENLNLSSNEFRVFPDIAQLARLKRLSLNFNWIDGIVTRIKPSSLTALSLRGNGISVIGSEVFSELTQLEELDLSQNRLRALPPNWHFGMLALHTFNLESNQFENIADMSVYALFSLRRLRIKGNVVRTVDVNTLKSLPEECVLYVS